MSTCKSNFIFNGISCACPAGTYNNVISCIACPDKKCKKCDSFTCQNCFEGYYPVVDKCLACSDHCSQCFSSSSC